jgi:hypothetical protein
LAWYVTISFISFLIVSFLTVTSISISSIEQGSKDSGAQGDKLFQDEELVQLIDPILSMDDSNNDGYIDYPEFIRAQQNAAANVRT